MVKDLNLKPSITYIVEELMKDYGSDVTLGRLFLELTRGRSYRCAKCKGKGFVTIKQNVYHYNNSYIHIIIFLYFE